MNSYLVEICITKFVKVRLKAKTERQAEIKARKKVLAKSWKVTRKDLETPNVMEIY